jgi:hypothetical protein
MSLRLSGRKKILHRIKTFDDWCQERPRCTDAEKPYSIPCQIQGYGAKWAARRIRGVNPMLRQKRPIGRPSLFTTELGDTICNRIADRESLRAICEEADMPDKATVFRGLLAEQHKDFRNQYIRARDIQADVLFDEIHQIADTPQKGTKTVRRGEGDNSTVETTEADMIDHRRLQIDARKWLIGKMAPKKYGDKQQIEHAGPDGGPITLEALIMARIKKKEWPWQSTRSVPGGAAERLARECRPPRSSPARAARRPQGFFGLAVVIGRARVRAYWWRKSYIISSADRAMSGRWRRGGLTQVAAGVAGRIVLRPQE